VAVAEKFFCGISSFETLENMVTKVVRFLKDQWVVGFSMYSQNEIAGFPAELADSMIARGVCALEGDGIPKNTDGSRFVPKGGLAKARELLGEITEKLKA
jgi:hypothetical protein